MNSLIGYLLIASLAGISCMSLERPEVEKKDDIVAPIVISVANEDQPHPDTTQRRLVAYLNFENITSTTTISDYSGYENDADIDEDGTIVKIPDSTCGQAALLPDNSAICFKGETFQAKPRKAVTIAAWIKLRKSKGFHSIFDTIGCSHPQGQFHFEIDDGIVRWFHRDENQKVVFETMAGTVPQGEWVHVAGTYQSKSRQAKIFIRGEIKNLTIGDGLLSRDWSVKACIGHHQNGRPLKGYIDEFRIYNYQLKQTEIKALVSKCKFEEKPLSQKQRSCVGPSCSAGDASPPSDSSAAKGSAANDTPSNPTGKTEASPEIAPVITEKAPAKSDKPAPSSTTNSEGDQPQNKITESSDTGSEGRDLKSAENSKPDQNESTGDNVLKKSAVKTSTD